MLQYKKDDNTNINAIINQWLDGHKAVYSNFFGLDNEKPYEYIATEHAVLIRTKEFYFYRVYFMSDNKEEIVELLKQMTDSTYVFNLPTKKPFEEWDALLTECGFEYYETYTKYSIDMSTKQITPVEHVEDAHIEESEAIMSLLMEGLPIFTAHLPEKEKLEQLISEKKVRVTRDENGGVTGVCISYVTGTTASGDAWVNKGEHGLDLLMDMYNGFINNGAKRYLFWVRDSNTKVRKMYIRSGAVSLGIKDYTYVKYNK